MFGCRKRILSLLLVLCLLSGVLPTEVWAMETPGQAGDSPSVSRVSGEDSAADTTVLPMSQEADEQEPDASETRNLSASSQTSGTCGDNLIWELDGSGVLTIRGTGPMDDYEAGDGPDGSPWYANSQIIRVVIENGVTGIGSKAFYACENLTGVAIPDSVTYIGEYAFAYCRNLTSISLPAEITSLGTGWFESCSSLTQLTIPDSVTTLESYCLSGCSSLTQLTIPDGVTAIHTGALRRCTSLTELTLPDGISTLEKNLLAGCTGLTSLDIPDSVTSIGESAFSGCTGLTELVIPDGVTSIGTYAFFECTGLTHMTVPDEVTTIGANAFMQCENLETIALPEGLEAIEKQTFYLCGKLTGITIPSTVSSIGEQAFSCCKNLRYVTLPERLTSIERRAFEYCVSLQELTIPQSVTDIGTYAFLDCSSLTEVVMPAAIPDMEFSFDGCDAVSYVTFYGTGAMRDFASFDADGDVTSAMGRTFTEYTPWAVGSAAGNELTIEIQDGVTTVGNRVFSGCSGIVRVLLPDSITEIGYEAFKDCPNIAGSVNLSHVEAIRDRAFQRCSSLTELTFSDGLTVIGQSAFYGCAGLEALTIPASASRIGQDAFFLCSGLTWIQVDSGNPAYASEDGVLFTKDQTALLLYPAAKAGASYAIPDGVTAIRENAFYGCRALDEIVIPDSVTSIGSSAFEGCSALTRINLPESMTEIPASLFEDCASLTRISLPDGVTGIGAAAFEGCGSLTGLQLPDTVTSIGGRAFYGCSSLTSIEIPQGVSELSGWTFCSCYALTDITIPVRLKSIEDYTFYSCSRLNDIYYAGSQAQWELISVGSNNGSFSRATVHYLSGPVRNLRIEDVSLSYSSTANGIRSYSGFVYDDSWFTQDSYSYNHELAVMSLGLAMTGFDVSGSSAESGDANVKALYRELDFDVTQYYSVGYGQEDSDSVAMAICPKRIVGPDGTETVLLAVCLRGGGYGDGGWVGNLEVGNTSAYHVGFYRAAQYAAGQIEDYLSRAGLDAGSVRIWLTGFSRSAATANLLSTLLSIRGMCRRENIYTYTFATPSNQLIRHFSSSYDNIFNILNPYDIVPMVPLKQWNFGKQGTTYELFWYPASTEQYETFSRLFSELSGQDYPAGGDHRAIVSYLMGLLAESFGDRDAYHRELESVLIRFMQGDYSGFDELLCGVTTVEEQQELWERGSYVDAVLKLSAAVAERYQRYGENDPYIVLLQNFLDLLIIIATEQYDNHDGPGTQILELILDVAGNGSSSNLLTQHWPELYMAWMRTAELQDIQITGTYKIATVACPVNVEVYDAAGQLVAKTVTETVTLTDRNGEEYTYTVSVIDEDSTTIEAAVLGEKKLFVLPDDQEYRIEIIADETYTDGDTMDYTVSSFSGGEETASILYRAVPLETGSAFTAAVPTSEEEIESCTISEAGTQLQPTQISKDQEEVHLFSDLDVQKIDGQYRVAGTLSAVDEAVSVYCGIYSADGKLLAAESRTAQASREEQDLTLTIEADGSAAYMKVFTLGTGSVPLDEAILLYL